MRTEEEDGVDPVDVVASRPQSGGVVDVADSEGAAGKVPAYGADREHADDENHGADGSVVREEGGSEREEKWRG